MSEEAPPALTNDPDRRDFLRLSAGAALACCLLPMPEASANEGPKEVDLSSIREGETKVILWRGKPVFVRHRSAAEVEAVRRIPLAALKNPERDEDRTAQSVFEGKVLPEWLITLGSCSHLACVPRARPRDGAFEWFCPCHGSRFDASGRVLNGPAEKNMAVPSYRFIAPLRVVVG